MGATSSKVGLRKADSVPIMPISEVQGAKQRRVSIDYKNSVTQVCTIPMDVFFQILTYTSGGGGKYGQVRWTQCCGALETLKLLVAKNLAATCKVYHRHFLGWFRPDDLFVWLQGSWYNQSIWTQGLSEQRRNAFVFHFQPSAVSSATHSRVSVLPLLLVAPCERLPETQQACDEHYKTAAKKTMQFAYSNLVRNNAEARALQSQQYHLACPHVSIALESLLTRTCLIRLRFAASIDKRHANSSEVTLTFKAYYTGGDSPQDSPHRWRVEGMERIPTEETHQVFLAKKWDFPTFSMLAPMPGSFRS